MVETYPTNQATVSDSTSVSNRDTGSRSTESCRAKGGNIHWSVLATVTRRCVRGILAGGGGAIVGTQRRGSCAKRTRKRNCCCRVDGVINSRAVSCGVSVVVAGRGQGNKKGDDDVGEVVYFTVEVWILTQSSKLATIISFLREWLVTKGRLGLESLKWSTQLAWGSYPSVGSA